MTTDYPGNSALPAEVKQRVLSTFRQTLDLYNQGLLDDVVVGCEFLLKMDPLFQPAKKLMEKAKNPASTVDVPSLMALVGPAPAAPQGAAPSSGRAAAPASPSATALSLSEARAALADREFQRAIDLTSEVLRTDMMNEEAQRLAEEAREKLEADPFIQQFAAKVRQQLDHGDAATARATLEKARGIDPDHPLVLQLDPEVAAAASRPAFDPLEAFGVSDAPTAKSGESPQTYDFTSFTPEAPKAPQVRESFVVDPAQPQQPDSPRGGASASDFGFTFEEDKGEAPEITIGNTQPGTFGYTGGSQQEAAEAVSGDTFDFSTVSADLSGEDQAKIDAYLRQGDAANEQLDYQKAIDIWSRIFLIDVTNDQASGRIEKARAKKAEIDNKVDDLMGEVAIAAERQDHATVKRLLERVIAIDPSNTAAVAQLEQVHAAAAAAPSPTEAPRAPASPAVPPAAAAASGAASTGAHPFDEPLYVDEPLGGSVAEPILGPRDSGETFEDEGAFAPPRPPKARPAPVPSAPRSKALLFGAIAVVVLLVGTFAAWRIFSSPGDEPVVTAPSDALVRAQRLAAAGNLDDAIATLLTIPPEDPSHDEALTLVSELRARKAQTSGLVEGRPASEVFAELIAEGQRAAESSDFRAAKAAFEQAASIQPLPPEARAIYDRVVANASALDIAENLLKSGNYPQAIAAAEAVLQQNPNHPYARNLIRDARFNLGVVSLQQERLQDAVLQFDQVLTLDPNDHLAKRARELAVRYETTPKDLLYRIFVRHLKLR